MTCDLCTEPATVHVCEIRDGVKTEKHLCAEHNEQIKIPNLAVGQMAVNGVICSSVEEAAVQGILENLRGTRNFCRQHGRMPSSVEELEKGMSLPDEGPDAEINDPELLQEFRRLDALVRFIQM